VAKLCYNRQNVYCLSGTPVLNDPKELYPQLVACGKHQFFGAKSTFEELYGKGGKSKAKALAFLNYLMHKHCYFRRLKSEVATEIPPKTRRVILCEIDNRAEYDLAVRNFKKYLEEKMKMTGGQVDKAMRAEALVQMQYLKFLSAKGKLAAIQEWIDSLADEGEKAVIFVYRKEIQEEIYQYRKEGTVRLCSSAPPDVLAKRKEQFQTDDRVQRIVCSISADAEGHTLTAATNLAMFELPWHFGKAEQCEDRIHRIGTIHPVSIDYFLGERTIDRDIYDLIMEKKEMHDTITGTDEAVENQVVDKLISLFNQK
jgi:SWI/SNF-related matrix-associated actin-dependent regulator 1 of chromatin subfamily A